MTRTNLFLHAMACLLWTSGISGAQSVPNYLETPTYFPSMPAYPPTQIAVGDLNQDGRDDIVTTNGSLNVSLSLPNGQLSTPITYPYGSAMLTYPMIGDFNRDGIPDIALLIISSPSILIFANDGAGGFAPLWIWGASYPIGGLYAVDLDSDGFPEIIAPCHAGNIPLCPFTTLLVLSTSGGSLTQTLLYPTGQTLGPLRFGDVTGDGFIDLVATTNSTNPLPVVLIQQGLGNSSSFGSVWTLPMPSTVLNWGSNSLYTINLQLGDLDGNGTADIILSADPYGTPPFVPIIATCIAPTSGGGWWQLPVPAFARNGRTRFFTADVNGDSRLDLAGVRNEYGPPNQGQYVTRYSSIFCALGTANGQLLAPMSMALPAIPPLASSTDRIWGFAVGDIDGDGDPELVFVDNQLAQIGVARNRARFGSPYGNTGIFSPLLGSGLPTPGNAAFAISLGGIPANTPALLALSFATNPVGGASPILVDLLPANLVLPLSMGLTQTNALGVASIALPIPANPALLGSVVFGQWGLSDPLLPGGLILSSGATFIVW